MNLYGSTTIIIRVSHSSTNISMFSKKSLIVGTPHHTFYHKNKHLHKHKVDNLKKVKKKVNQSHPSDLVMIRGNPIITKLNIKLNYKII
jgi:hypothetical protein